MELTYKSINTILNNWVEKNTFYPIIIFIFLFFPNIYSQHNSSVEYKTIIEHKLLSKDSKVFKIDSLLNQYEVKKEYEKLFDDIYSYAVWYYNAGNYEAAIDICSKGITVSKKFKKPDSNRLAGLKNTIGSSHLKMGNYDSAFNAYKNIIETVKIDQRIARAYHGMAECSKLIGDYYTANDYYEVAISKAQELENKYFHIVFTIDQGDNYYQIANKKLKQKGVKSAKQILKLSETDTNYSKVFYPFLKILTLQNIGGLQVEISDDLFKEAERHYSEALEIAKHIDNKDQIGAMYNALGYVSMKQNKPETLIYLDNSLSYLNDTKKKSICYSNKAFYYANNNQFEKALYNAQKAIGLLAKFDANNNSPNIDALKESPYKHELLTALIEKAEILIKKNKISRQNEDLTSALKLLNRSDELTEFIRLESDATESKLFWRTMTSRIYTNAVDICYKLNNDEQALYYIEKNKALLLLEDINQKKYLSSANIPNHTIKKYNQLKSTISEQTQSLYKSSDSTSDSLRLELVNTKNNLREFTDSLQATTFSPYFKITNSINIISLSQIKNSLSDNETYINYILNDDLGYGIAITKKQNAFFKIDQLDTLKALSKRYNSFLVKPLNSKTEFEEFDTVAKQLYKLLFPDKVVNLIKDKTLIISPDYYLQNIPFEALKKEKSNTHLIEDHIISYIYSITFLEENKKLNRVNDQQFLGFAPIDFNNNLSNLSRTKNELEKINEVIGGQALYNGFATSNSFRQQIRNYDIIHLATHANATDSIRPWIAFQDKLLTLDELYLTRNSAELVVLSACETGIGELKQGEGVMSLARGFFNTGANSVLSSLWNVNDKSSSEIMVDFYKNLKDGKTKSEALRISKLNYLKSHKLSELSPHYWASFVLIGDSNSIPSILNNSNSLFLIGISLALLFIGLIYFKLKK